MFICIFMVGNVSYIVHLWTQLDKLITAATPSQPAAGKISRYSIFELPGTQRFNAKREYFCLNMLFSITGEGR